MARKTKTLPKLTDECAVLLQKIVRMKQAIYLKSPYIACVTCGKIDHWKNQQGGHFISRTWTATKILEENIHPQCISCNGFRPKLIPVGINHEAEVVISYALGSEAIA